MRLRRLFVYMALIAATALAACSSGGADTTTTPGPSGEVTVFAASSLTEVFQRMKTAYEAKYPGTTVTFNFAGTPTLRTQLEQGARADVFASANEEQMRQAVTAGVIEGDPVTVATNRLVVIKPAGNLQVQEMADLAADGTLIVLALPNVPVGAYSRQALQQLSGVNGLPDDFGDRAIANVVSEEANVRQVVAKVSLGEADAGIVYETDVIAEVRDNMETIEIPDEANVIASYPLAQVDRAPNPVAGAAFIEFVLSEEGQIILAESGFGAPPQ